MTNDGVASGTRSKVGRVIEEYGLDGMGDRLERSWLGDGEPERSLRELADHFNRAVLEARMRDAGMQPLDGEVDNLYRLLTDDDVSAGQRAEAEAKLEHEGIDPEALSRDFVSHQAVHTYLTDHRGAEFPSTDTGDRTESAMGTVESTKGRLERVVEGTLSNLGDADELTLGEFDVHASAQVYCEDCETQYEVATLLERGGCDCG